MFLLGRDCMYLIISKMSNLKSLQMMQEIFSMTNTIWQCSQKSPQSSWTSWACRAVLLSVRSWKLRRRRTRRRSLLTTERNAVQWDSRSQLRGLSKVRRARVRFMLRLRRRSVELFILNNFSVFKSSVVWPVSYCQCFVWIKFRQEFSWTHFLEIKELTDLPFFYQWADKDI